MTYLPCFSGFLRGVLVEHCNYDPILGQKRGQKRPKMAIFDRKMAIKSVKMLKFGSKDTQNVRKTILNTPRFYPKPPDIILVPKNWHPPLVGLYSPPPLSYGHMAVGRGGICSGKGGMAIFGHENDIWRFGIVSRGK